MRTFRIRSTVAAIAAAIPLSIGLNVHADDRASMSRSSAAPAQSAQQQNAQQHQQGPAHGQNLVGKELYGARGDKIGEISDVVVSNEQVTAVVADVGGFLGIGEKTISIPMNQLQIGEDRVTATSLAEGSGSDSSEERSDGRNSARDDSNRSALSRPNDNRVAERDGGNGASGNTSAYGSASASTQEGNKLVGKDLYGANGEEVGEISNVVMEDGDAAAVLVDVGGFLGVGAKTVAIPVNDLQVGQDRVTAAGLTEERARNMPEYDRRDQAGDGSRVNRGDQTAWGRDSAGDRGMTGTTQSAGATQSPGVTQSSGATQSSQATQSSGATQSPEVTQSSGATQSPEVTQSSEATSSTQSGMN